MLESPVEGETDGYGAGGRGGSVAGTVDGVDSDPGRYDVRRSAAWEGGVEFRGEGVLQPTGDWLENMACGQESV